MHAAGRSPAGGVVAAKLAFHALTPERWSHLNALFGERGACGGCWCMAWRLGRKEVNQNKGEGNRRAFRKIVWSGAEPGVLAYIDGEPVGWCAVAPRDNFSFLSRSRVLAPVDRQQVWSITCFFVAKPWRKKGLSVELLRAATAHAQKRGARIIEGYPQEIKKDLPAAFVWTGTATAFRKAGFKEVARRSRTRPIMRIATDPHTSVKKLKS